ncbi:hypothetical protein FN846DRAFT_903128 [Sphaerosporella brunnea]|uniref:Rhodopsin domain-containing protein n=1 Tax=Sphaerosporella brunnea TaxID=1250544 RepID=A0A5J5F7F8_9PEZI|nr:hypothetical protein FN846DRAFT_903128 [Sphaerosporella brunnea]
MSDIVWSGTQEGQQREALDHAALITLWACTFVALALILTRIIWRFRRREDFPAEDIWMVSSILPLLLRLAFIHISLYLLTTYFDRKKYLEQFMTGDEIWDRALGSRMILPGRLCYAAFLWTMKVVILLWFEKVTGNVWPYGLIIKGSYVFVGVTFVGVVLATLLECRPINLYWQVFPDPGNCVMARGQLLTMGAMNIATDICLMIIPLPLVLGAKLPTLRKLQLLFLFSVSLFIICITVVRMPVIIGNRAMQRTRSLWASIEVMVACLVANAPVLNSFFHSAKQHHTRQQYDQQRGSSDAYVSTVSQRRRGAQMPVTGQDSFGSLTRNDGFDSLSTKTGAALVQILDAEQAVWRDSARNDRALAGEAAAVGKGRDKSIELKVV